MTSSPIPPRRLKELEAGWPLHRGFGACCDPGVFHLAGVWHHVRQSPALYSIAALLTGETKLWVDINRSIHKLPKQGEAEFLHWDLNPFAGSAVTSAGTTAAGGKDGVAAAGKDSLCGKVCYTPSRFVGVLKSHTSAFHARFSELYREIYPKVKPEAPKFGLDPAKPDPLNLWSQQREFAVPAGCAVFWHPRLLHGQVKTPAEAGIEYGCYVGFFPAGARPEYRRAAGVDELEDRLSSYTRGVAPVLWPSLDRIHYYPKRFRNFPKLLQGYIDKMPPGHPWVTLRTTGGGKSVPHIEPCPAPEYTPPKLSSLGKRLLGKKAWKEKAPSAVDGPEGRTDAPVTKRRRKSDGQTQSVSDSEPAAVTVEEL